MTSHSSMASCAWALNFSAEVSLAAQVQSSGIDYGKDASIPLSVGIDAVTSSSRQIFDYSQPLAGQLIEEGGLADIGPADDGNKWFHESACPSIHVLILFEGIEYLTRDDPPPHPHGVELSSAAVWVTIPRGTIIYCTTFRFLITSRAAASRRLGWLSSPSVSTATTAACSSGDPRK